MTQDFLSKPYPVFLHALNKRAESGHPFIVGDKLTIADFMFGAFIFTLIYNEAANPQLEILRKMFEQHAALKTYAEHLKKVFAEYLATRPKSDR